MSHFPLLCVAALMVAPTTIIIRDDVPDAEYRALGARAEFASAVRILSDSGGTGSGVLVDPHWVITAAHVAYRRPPAMLQVLVAGVRYRVRSIVIYPGYAEGVPGMARTANDQALLELDSVPPVTPMALSATLPSPGTRVTFVGYGVGGVGARDTAGTLRGGQNRVDQIGGAWRGSALANHLLLTDFDVPGFANRSVLGSAEPEPLEGMASGGDSGGGAFAQIDGRWQLVGTFAVSSFDLGAAASRQFAGSINIFVGVAPHREWIGKIIRGER